MKAIELFEKQVKRAEALLKIHKTSFPKGRPASGGEPADLLRAIVVFAVAAFDTYIHRRISECVSAIIRYKGRFPIKCVDLIANQFKDGKRMQELITIALKPDPKKTLSELITRALAGRTFQKPDDIDKAFEMMEVSEPWKRVNKLVNLKPGPKRKGRKEDARKFLLVLADRRDDIVHEGDVYISKKHHGSIKKIGRAEVSQQIQRLRRIVEAIEGISGSEN